MSEPLYQDFIFKPETGDWRWFRAAAPIPWTEARDRLISVGIGLRESLGLRGHPQKWMLSVSTDDLDLLHRSGLTPEDLPDLTQILALLEEFRRSPAHEDETRDALAIRAQIVTRRVRARMVLSPDVYELACQIRNYTTAPRS